MHILVVEDDRALAEALVHILCRAGYTADAVHDGQAGLEHAATGRYDAVVFDIMLPRLDGVSAVGELRRRGVRTPVLMLTARDAVPDKIEGLDGGADAYMTKPFAPKELLARLRALTRRTVDVAAPDLAAGDLRLSPTTRQLACGAESIQLSNKEFLMAELLMRDAGAVVGKGAIAREVWGADAAVDDNNIEAYVSMLRKKLRFLGSRMRLKLVRRVGYQLVEREAEPAAASGAQWEAPC